MSPVSCLLSPCLTSHVSRLPVSPLLSHVFFLTLPVTGLLSHVYCLISPVSCLLSHVSCLTYPVSCLLSHVTGLPVSCLLSLCQLFPCLPVYCLRLQSHVSSLRSHISSLTAPVSRLQSPVSHLLRGKGLCGADCQWFSGFSGLVEWISGLWQFSGLNALKHIFLTDMKFSDFLYALAALFWIRVFHQLNFQLAMPNYVHWYPQSNVGSWLASLLL